MKLYYVYQKIYVVANHEIKCDNWVNHWYDIGDDYWYGC